MTKWPKEWLNAACQSTSAHRIAGLGHVCEMDNVLDALHAIGALRDPPKKLELWECQRCGYRTNVAPNAPVPTLICSGGVHPYIHFVETDDND